MLRNAVTGGAAGAAATVPMSLVMWLAQQAGLVGQQPPERITEAALDAAEVDRDEETEDRLALVNHVAFGATCGGVYAVLRRRSARNPVHDLGMATVYALTIWLASYRGWIPALGILPPVEDDRSDRQAVMAFSHVVYGVALGAALRGLRRR